MFFKVFFCSMIMLAFSEKGWMDCCCSKLPNRYGFNPLESFSEHEEEVANEELEDQSSHPLEEVLEAVNYPLKVKA